MAMAKYSDKVAVGCYLQILSPNLLFNANKALNSILFCFKERHAHFCLCSESLIVVCREFQEDPLDISKWEVKFFRPCFVAICYVCDGVDFNTFRLQICRLYLYTPFILDVSFAFVWSQQLAVKLVRASLIMYGNDTVFMHSSEHKIHSRAPPW